MKGKKGDLKLLSKSIMAFVVAIIIAVVGLNIMINVRDTNTDGLCSAGFGYSPTQELCVNATNTSHTVAVTETHLWNGTMTGVESVDTLVGWFPTIAIVLAAVVVLSYVAYLKMR